jgi:adenylate cyclase
MWEKLKKRLWQWRGIVIAVPNATIIIIVFRLVGLLQGLELTALDKFFLLRPTEPVDRRIVIVDITEADIRQQGRWPISDAVLANLLNRIKQQKPRAIGLDIYRNLAVNPGHQDLVKVFKSTPNLVGIQKVYNNADSADVDPPPDLKRLNQVAGNDLPLDGDGKIRRALLYLSTKKGAVLYGFGLKLAVLYLNTEGVYERPSAINRNYLQLGRGIFPKFTANEGGYIGASSGDYQILLNYRGSTAEFKHVSLTTVLQNRIPSDLMRDKVVLIGSSAESLKDILYTPYTSQVFATPQRMAGVVIHANFTSQILSAALDGRPQIQTWAEPVKYVWILIWATIGSTLCWLQRHHNSPLITVSVIFAGGTLLVICYVAFLFGWWIPLIPPLLALIGSAIAITQYVAHSAANMQKTFGRYLSDEVVTTLIDTPSGLTLGGERRKVTILMSDLRGFSAISEQYPPEQVVRILNLYLAAMTDIIDQYKGTINDFMGDGILVMFGAPISREDDTERAIACAIAMQLAMPQVNAKNQQMNLPTLEMGIGINTGEVIAGNIGSQKRAEYTVIGSHVNLAARVESYTVGGQVLISENTFADIDIDLRIDGKLEVEPKGVKQPINLYEIGGIGGKYNLNLPKAEEEIISLSEGLPVEYIVLQDKNAGGKLLTGMLIGLSERSAQLYSNHTLERLSNIKLRLLTETALFDEEPDIYAKVIKQSVIDEHNFVIRFTALTPKAINRLDRLRQVIGA